jgi:hypothetical protein
MCDNTSSTNFKDFLGVLDASEIYFNETDKQDIKFPAFEIDLLRQKNQTIQEENLEITLMTEKLNKHYLKLYSFALEQNKLQEKLESSIQSIQNYSKQLEKKLQQSKIMLNILKTQKKHLKLSEVPKTQQSSPIPIKYKPIKTRSQRNSLTAPK